MKKREPDFQNLLAVLQKKKPQRDTLFEFFLNDRLYDRLTEGCDLVEDELYPVRKLVKAFEMAGYDYCTLHSSDFGFEQQRSNHGKASLSINEGAGVVDRESFAAYHWNNPDDYDYSRLERLALPEGMKLIVYGPGGVMENVIAIIGYENLCYMLADDPGLVQMVFDEVGSRLVRYYELSVPYASVGAVISNDDWGFQAQPLLSISDMEKYVYPWHRKIVEVIHRAGKPAILHSCGNSEKTIDAIIDDIGYDAKHSYEDNIKPVEEEYEALRGRIAVLGGIDVNFLCTRTPEEIYLRSKEMLERTRERGGYALGSGNSIPYYVPDESYFAMIRAALE